MSRFFSLGRRKLAGLFKWGTNELLYDVLVIILRLAIGRIYDWGPFILYFVSDPELESETEPESESIRSPESESELEQPHHDSAPLGMGT